MAAGRALRIVVAAGEPSGDLLAASVIRVLKQRHPDMIIEGIAGPAMEAAGCKTLYSISALSVMLFSEILTKIFSILRLRQNFLRYCIENPPDLFIGFDSAAFNLPIAKKLRARGIKTIQYNGPKIWAWRPGRLKKIKAACSKVLTLFPFENNLYQAANVPHAYIGHPMADEIAFDLDKQIARDAIGLIDNKRDLVIALLPGSRSQELQRLGKIMLESAEKIAKQIPQISFIMPMANEKRVAQMNAIISQVNPNISLKLVLGQAREAMIASDAVIVTSGTATLEALLIKKPMVVIYRLSAISYWLLKHMVICRFIALPNLLADAPIVPELIQSDANPEKIASTVLQLLSTDNTALLAEFDRIHRELSCQSSEQAANAIDEELK